MNKKIYFFSVGVISFFNGGNGNTDWQNRDAEKKTGERQRRRIEKCGACREGRDDGGISPSCPPPPRLKTPIPQTLQLFQTPIHRFFKPRSAPSGA